jgi:hypothetical protein
VKEPASKIYQNTALPSRAKLPRTFTCLTRSWLPLYLRPFSPSGASMVAPSGKATPAHGADGGGDVEAPPAPTVK